MLQKKKKIIYDWWEDIISLNWYLSQNKYYELKLFTFRSINEIFLFLNFRIIYRLFSIFSDPICRIILYNVLQIFQYIAPSS